MVLPLIGLALALQAVPLPPAPAARPAFASRAQLEQELAQLAPGSGEAALIRARLANGDFQPGDRIVLRVEGEPQLSDTFTVAPATSGPELSLPQVGTVPLAGVLRAELQGHLTEQLGRYLRDPRVEVAGLIQLMVTGAVVRPGFYPVGPEQPLSDVITAAGGFTQQAKVNALRVERAGATIWAGAPLQQALGRGATLDQLNLRAGDRVYVPSRGDSERSFRMLSILLSIPVAVYTITRIF